MVRGRKERSEEEEKQEQTMFDDLRRGFTEDFQGLTEFEKDRPKKTPKFKRFCVFGLFDLQNDLESQI